MNDYSSKFDYNSLVFELRKSGVDNTKDLSAILKQIALDNNISDIKSLDGTKEITVKGSVFDGIIDTGEESPVIPVADVQEDELPEIYNDDDYEVAEYDDFYNFQTEEQAEEKSEETPEEELDFDTFKEEYSAQFTAEATSPFQKEELMKQIFGSLDTNSDDVLDKNELLAAMYSPYFAKKDKEFETANTEDSQDLLGQDMMNMDMQNDSFNPQD